MTNLANRLKSFVEAKKDREGRDGREMETDRKLCNEKPQRYFVAV